MLPPPQKKKEKEKEKRLTLSSGQSLDYDCCNRASNQIEGKEKIKNKNKKKGVKQKIVLNLKSEKCNGCIALVSCLIEWDRLSNSASQLCNFNHIQHKKEKEKKKKRVLISTSQPSLLNKNKNKNWEEKKSQLWGYEP